MARQRCSKADDQWPCWCYGPDGQTGMFNKPEDLPEGWSTSKFPVKEEEPPIPDKTIHVDHDYVRDELIKRGYVIKGWWSGAYMKQLLDGVA